VEGHNFDIRKHILEYDDVMNQQREVIYRQRREALTSESLKPSILEMIAELAEDVAYAFSGRGAAEPISWEAVSEAVERRFFFTLEKPEDAVETMAPEVLAEAIRDAAVRIYEEKEVQIGENDMRQLERFIVLQTVDAQWKDHLLSMDHLKDGIGLRGYAQQNPLIIYKKEGFAMFQDMIHRVKSEVVGILFRVQIRRETELEPLPEPRQQKLIFSHGKGDESREPVRRKDAKVGRNDLCPCGSGKKYKKCCG
jgi:preprotein translocase subunit SecA